eukprot:CAMPEP_0117440318 /NCGR_PEP_ID=MMETSP0759-20121206/3024_1 /TAXON_ID=63605 /ORGANISM="Percolomonas cosmopolitus, Strain WS" /LENGTH=373 /DNA_ID=CAMNT_0005232071 /DNA_START=3232 /DNA_END=4350 /DNA_ORIENTATION=+
MNSAVEVSPMWDHDELQYRKDLELAANGFKESTTTSFLDVNFFDFLALATEQPRKIEEPFLLNSATAGVVRAGNLGQLHICANTSGELQKMSTRANSNGGAQSLGVEVNSFSTMAAVSSEWENSQSSMDSAASIAHQHKYDSLQQAENALMHTPSPPHQQRKRTGATTSAKKKKKTTITMKFSMKHHNSDDDDSQAPKMRSPQSRTMEPISPIVTQVKKTATRKRKRASGSGKDGVYKPGSSGLNSQSVGTPVAGGCSDASSTGSVESLNSELASGSAGSPPAKKRRRTNSSTKASGGGSPKGACGTQSTCCVKGCEGLVTNRLRTSLRGTTEADFKEDFWDVAGSKSVQSATSEISTKIRRDRSVAISPISG